MCMCTKGAVCVYSKIDPRWNFTQSNVDLCFSAGYPEEVKQHLKKCEELYGEQPADLKFTGCKY